MISAGDTDAPYTFGARRAKQGQCQGQSMVGVKPGVGQQYTSLVAGYFRTSLVLSFIRPASQASSYVSAFSRLVPNMFRPITLIAVGNCSSRSRTLIPLCAAHLDNVGGAHSRKSQQLRVERAKHLRHFLLVHAQGVDHLTSQNK